MHLADWEENAFTVVALEPDTWELFEGRAGFEYVRPKGLRNCVVRRSVDPLTEAD